MIGNPSRAQQALETCDQQGEAALLDFLIVHRKPNPDRSARMSQGRRLHVFEDGSAVEIEFRHHLYTFTWEGGTWEPKQETRPATQLAETMPFPPGPDTPLLNWPSVASVSDAIIRRLERQAQDKTDWENSREYGEDPVLNQYQRLTLAPVLKERIRDFMEKPYDMPDGLLTDLDREQEYCAKKALETLPEEQRAALTGAVAQAVQAQGEG